ncbi:hypothetical protein [Streptomyces lasiicapitis]|uniref:hypothetical protein n=1 Tax=Streptomyces lasiicapitis TaxID=1923961 RepID=UPI0036603F2F
MFNTARVKPSGLACELVVPLEQAAGVSVAGLDRQFARIPYAVSFLSSGQTFTLVTLHVNYGKKAAERVPELKAIAPGRLQHRLPRRPAVRGFHLHRA